MIKCCLRRPENILSNHCSWGKKRIIGIHIDSYFTFFFCPLHLTQYISVLHVCVLQRKIQIRNLYDTLVQHSS